MIRDERVEQPCGGREGRGQAHYLPERGLTLHHLYNVDDREVRSLSCSYSFKCTLFYILLVFNNRFKKHLELKFSLEESSVSGNNLLAKNIFVVSL